MVLLVGEDNMSRLKKLGADAIMLGIIIPLIAWGFSFILSAYASMNKVTSLEDDIKEIKADVKDINKFLREEKK